MGNYLSQNDDEVSVIKKLYNLDSKDFSKISGHLKNQQFNNLEKGFLRSIYNKNITLKNKIPDSKFVPIHSLLTMLTQTENSNNEKPQNSTPKKEYKLDEVLKIFSLNRNYTEKELKLSYRKLALRYHPDREGGDINKFKLVTQFFETLTEDLLLKKNDKQFTELKNGSQDFIKQQGSDNKKNLKLNSFDQSKFNQIFDENRVEIEDADSHGYSDWMNDNKYNKTDIKKTKLTGSFSVKNFNSEYDKNNQQTQEIVEFKIPDAFGLSESLSYRELGQGSNVNYTTKKYSDFREAHTTSRLAPDGQKREQYKNIDDLKSNRSNIKTYSEEELSKIKQYENNNRMKDEEKQKNVSRHDEIYFRNFNTINKQMLDRNILR